ncbi:hypothetical protein BC826DRAFT_1064392 [Russula brevipes]|nr:hypothetical protein BC826DRAFT_1064392 [Russula brevipes]
MWRSTGYLSAAPLLSAEIQVLCTNRAADTQSCTSANIPCDSRLSFWSRQHLSLFVHERQHLGPGRCPLVLLIVSLHRLHV